MEVGFNRMRPRDWQVGFPDEDADVQSEREYIHATPLRTLFETDAIVVRGLTKSFSGFRAVDNLTFRVPRVSDRRAVYKCARVAPLTTEVVVADCHPKC